MVSDWKKAAWSRSKAAEESSADAEDEDARLFSGGGGEEEKKHQWVEVDKNVSIQGQYFYEQIRKKNKQTPETTLEGLCVLTGFCWIYSIETN